MPMENDLLSDENLLGLMKEAEDEIMINLVTPIDCH